MTTIYDFGAGGTPAHQHPNGGGWVADTARVDWSAYIGPRAQVRDSARVCGAARVCGSAQVRDSALVCDSAQVRDSAQVCGSAQVRDSAQVCGVALVGGAARVRGSCYRTPIHVALGYGVTVCDDVITVGCTTDTAHGWRTRQDWTRDPALREYADLILLIAERHQAKGPVKS